MSTTIKYLRRVSNLYARGSAKHDCLIMQPVSEVSASRFARDVRKRKVGTMDVATPEDRVIVARPYIPWYEEDETPTTRPKIVEEQVIRLTETITIEDSPNPEQPNKISKPIFIDLGEEPDIVTLDSDDEEEASRLSKQSDVTPHAATSKKSEALVTQIDEHTPITTMSTVACDTIANEILREARIYSLDLVLTKKAAAPIKKRARTTKASRFL